MIRILNGQLEKKLQDGRAWLAGKKLTIADFIVAASKKQENQLNFQ